MDSFVSRIMIFTALAISLLLLVVSSNQFFLEHINSDYLYLYETTNNFIQYKTIAGQNFPAAPYYFPDLFAVLLLQGVTTNITIIHLIYSSLFLLAFSAIAFALFSTFVKNTMYALLGTLTVVSSCFFITPTDLPYLKEWPGSHLSVILFSLFLLAYYIRRRNNAMSVMSFCLLFISSYLVFISDNLLFAQLFVPFSIVVFIDMRHQQTNKHFGLALLAIFLLVVLLGARFDLLMETYFDASYSLNASLFRIRKIGQIAHTIETAKHVIQLALFAHPVYYFTLFSFNLLSLILAFILYVKRSTDAFYHAKLTSLLAYFYLAQICNLVLAVLAAKINEVSHFRYLDTLHIYPSIAFTLLLMCYLERKLFVKALLLCMTISFTICLYIFFNINSRFLQSLNLNAPYTHLVQCIDVLQNQYALQNGLAEYWDTKEIRLLSKYHIKMSQVFKDLNFINYIDNKHTFYADRKLKHSLLYQFIVITPNDAARSLPKDHVLQVVGKPDKIAFCAGREIWLYTEKDSNKKLNAYFGNKHSM